MSLEAVAFFPEDNGITLMEREIIRRYAGKQSMFIVVKNETKANEMKSGLEPDQADHIQIALLRKPNDTGLKQQISNELKDSPSAEIDITFAPPYYAASMAFLGRRKGINIVFTRSDGSVDFIGQPAIDYRNLDEVDSKMVAWLYRRPYTAEQLSDLTKTNYKTASRRLARLLKEGYVVRGTGRPAMYSLNEDQKALFATMRGREIKKLCGPLDIGFGTMEAMPLSSLEFIDDDRRRRRTHQDAVLLYSIPFRDFEIHVPFRVGIL